MNKEILKAIIKNAAKEGLQNAARASNAWKILARHKNWVSGATIAESISDNGDRRFVATVDGWRNFLIYEGRPGDDVSMRVQTKVREIRDRLKAGDEKVLNENTRIS